MSNASLRSAARTWDDPIESLEATNARIHDGVPLERLAERADTYVRSIFDQFPRINVQATRRIMEIGSGTGFIMEGVDRYLRARRVKADSIAGLDIAPNMLAKAKARIGDRRPFEFILYDGLEIPVASESVDLVYSVAALQHVPKLYVYNLFLQIARILKPGGFAVMHFLAFRHIPEQIRAEPWAVEIRRQINNETGHWHHFYAAEELQYVLRYGSGFQYVDVRDGDSLWACVSKSP
jgi:ubiquinone/menaquinone biosynthesis C-methylase UbiE